MSPNTERDYRLALSKAGLLEGDPTQLPELGILRAAIEAVRPAKPPAPQQTSSVDKWRATIEALANDGAEPTAIYDHLRTEHNAAGFDGSLSAEIDNMVFEEGPAGKRIVPVDEVKAGENSTPKEAAHSLKKIESALQPVASGTAKLFSEQSPFELGTEIGANLEWSHLGSIKYETRGAANKTGWDHNLPYDAATLKKRSCRFGAVSRQMSKTR